ncbi:hypothetical protein PGC34_07085 [Pseudomonas kribbensis]|uniref:hypothetical protein n=1 Tax=Pseudomonas kribbensis TaxID=1628086 RepID=UPI0027387A20|nr:hypothetical protein [Pseudomonas sp. A29(2023)]MDL5595680.1 hypothetical protein [Bacillus subtilis]
MTWNKFDEAWIQVQIAWVYVQMASDQVVIAWDHVPEPYKSIILLAILGGSFAGFLYRRKAKSEKEMKDLGEKWKKDPLNKIR